VKKNLLLCLFAVVFLISSVFAMGDKPAKTMDANLDINAGVPTVIKIGAEWCPPCRQVKAMLKQVEKELKVGGIQLTDVDIDKYPEIAKKYKVSLIPTILFFDKNGKQVFKQVGPMDKEAFLNKLRELGMLE